MKIAVVYNRDSKNVINLFGVPNREVYGKKAITRIMNALRKYGHQAKAFEGREINVGLLGNNPPEALPPCEIFFKGDGMPIYTLEAKKGLSGRTIEWLCPAPLGEGLLKKAEEIAGQAFTALGCCDCARVDMRLDHEGNFHILEINSLPSLGEHGSYTIAAGHVGLDFPALINRLVEVAATRYFGTSEPSQNRTEEQGSPKARFFVHYGETGPHGASDWIEEWCALSSRTSDPVGNQLAVSRIDKRLKEIKMKPVAALTDERSGPGRLKRGLQKGPSSSVTSMSRWTRWCPPRDSEKIRSGSTERELAYPGRLWSCSSSR